MAKKLKEYDETRMELEATVVLQRSYSPYSGFKVGAALLCADGTIVPGTNVENAAYGVTICAERNAATTAVALGKREFLAILVIAEGEGECPPCGACRQVLNEFAPDMTVITIHNGRRIRMRLSNLLPKAFGPKNLDKKLSKGVT